MNLPIPDYSVIYNSKDISQDISGQVLSIQYTDKITGQSDELELRLEDSQALWQNTWYPKKGDSIQVVLRMTALQLNCGVFEIDEVSLAIGSGGDVFTIKALAAGITKKLRTKNTYAHEDKTLREIANTVAAGLGLSVLGTVPDIRIHRAHQYRETDLSFLNRVGGDYGCIFSVRGAQLIFTYYKDLEGRSPSLTLTRQDLISAELRDQSHKTFKACRVKHHDPISKDVKEYVANYDENEDDVESEDDLEIRTRVENKQQAEAKAKYALFKNNTQGVGGDVSMEGNLLFVAGNNFQLNGVGQFSGIFHIMESTHSIIRSGGYQTSGNIKRVKTIDSKFFKTK